MKHDSLKEILKPQLYDQSSTFLTACFIFFITSVVSLPLVQVAPSSAYKADPILLSKFIKISLIVIINKTGLIALPCGIPFSILSSSDASDPTFTLNLRSDKKI